MDENKYTDLVQTLYPAPVLEPEQMERIKTAIAGIHDAIEAAFVAAADALRRLSANMVDALRSMGGGIEWLNAYTWACEAHPKWVRIYHRTKKRRIAKKYRDRILRAYRAEKTKERERAGGS